MKRPNIFGKKLCFWWKKFEMVVMVMKKPPMQEHRGRQRVLFNI